MSRHACTYAHAAASSKIHMPREKLVMSACMHTLFIKIPRMHEYVRIPGIIINISGILRDYLVRKLIFTLEENRII